jgi:hypothetical protein
MTQHEHQNPWEELAALSTEYAKLLWRDSHTAHQQKLGRTIVELHRQLHPHSTCSTAATPADIARLYQGETNHQRTRREENDRIEQERQEQLKKARP